MIERAQQAGVPFQWVTGDEVYGGGSEWRILPAADHPEEPSRCLVTGTGLDNLRYGE